MLSAIKENWIVPTIGLVIIGVAGFGFFLPQHRKLKEIQTQIASRKLEIKEQTAKASIVPELLKANQAMKQRYSGFDKKLPQRRELGSFLRDISEGLSAEKLDNQLIEPGNPTRGSGRLFHTLPIIMRCRGTYLSVASFLDRIDNMARTTRVERLIINRARSDGKNKDGHSLDIELQMNIYFKPDARS